MGEKMIMKNKIALVTGSSRGIGKAIALAFAQEGADVILNCIKSKAAAQKISEDIKKLGRRSIVIEADVSKYSDVKKLFAEVKKNFGRLDILVNNAGIFEFGGKINEIPEKTWDNVLNINLKSVFLCTKEAVPLMKNGGSIINISSIYGVGGCDYASHYAASKAGIIALSESAAIELAPKIRVNAIAPGIIDTDMTANDTEENKKKYLSLTPMKRFGRPEEIAKAALFLASDNSSFVTGETLIVDGGLTKVK